MLRHLLYFQLKLILDGLRDAALIPVSIVAGLAGFFLRRQDPWLWYREVLHWGRATDRWIDLFDIHADEPKPDFDDLMEQTRQRLDSRHDHKPGSEQ